MQKLASKNKKSKMQSRYDALGSYTGTNSEDPFDMPIQDADDL